MNHNQQDFLLLVFVIAITLLAYFVLPRLFPLATFANTIPYIAILAMIGFLMAAILRRPVTDE